MMRFHFKEIKLVPGRKICIADALSSFKPVDDEMHARISSVTSSLHASNARLLRTADH